MADPNAPEELENAGWALFLRERLEKSAGERLGADDFLEGIMRDETVTLEELRRGLANRRALGVFNGLYKPGDLDRLRSEERA